MDPKLLRRTFLLILLILVIVPLLSFWVIAPMLRDVNGPGGMNLISFLAAFPVLILLGLFIGYCCRDRYYLLIPLALVVLTSYRTYVSATFWRDVSHAPLVAAFWWAIAFAFGLVISYWQCRRIARAA